MIGKILGKYEIVQRLGQGGMAEVYRAYQANLHRHVAIKLIKASVSEHPDYRARFEREAQSAARLDHPNIVHMYDLSVDAESGRPYMVMEYIEGEPLNEYVAHREASRRPLTVDEIAAIVGQVCDALAYAHAHGVIHRDIKPGNIMRTGSGRIILTDFGLAKLEGSPSLTQSDMTIGTPDYMSPEQAVGHPVDRRTDIYSLGIVLFRLLTGQLPFVADTPNAVALKRCTEPAPDPRQFKPDLPANLAAVVMRCMSQRPEERYQSAGELVADLRRALTGQAAAAPLSAPSSGPAEWDRAAIRQLLSEAFNDEEFEMLCYDHFGPVYESFGAGMTKTKKIMALMDHCHRHHQFELLIEAVKARNPAQYERFASRLRPGTRPPSEEKKAASTPFLAPREMGPIIGRESELDDIVPALTGSAGNRLCCLTGMGGIGKTSLASRVAHQLREHFDGVLWGDVYHSEPLTILDTWARAFGCDFSGLPDLDSRAAAMRNVLADKRVLVVLDDVWRADRARPLLPNGDECAVLITTRDVEVAAALNLTPYMVEALSPFESYQLMANILRHDPRLAAEKPVADEICALLAHLPLAVEIAAQRLLSRPGWKLADMAQRLRDEHTRLGELKVSNRAVRASFELSWNVLDNDQRQCFAALGVFEGRTFAVPALAAVAAQDELTARGHLDSLVALSLLDEEGAAHYHQHPLLADFAREKLGTMAAAQLPNDKAQLREFLEQRFDLEEIKNLAFDLGIDYTKLPHETTVMLSRELISFCERREILGNLAAKALSQRYNDDMVRLGQDQVAYTRMAQYYLRFAQERKTQYAELEAEWNNIWAGLRAAHQRQMWQVVLEYVEVLQDTWFARGHYTDARKGYSWLAEAAENLENRQVLAEALVEWGSACISQNDYAEAEAHLMAGHQIYQVLDDQGGIANVFYHRGRIALDQGKHSEAQQLLLAAQDLWTKHGNQPHIARTLYLLASIQLEHGHFDEAEQLGIAALKLHRATHNDLDTVRTLTLLAEIARAQYNFDVAIDHCHQALALGETLHNRNESALTLYTLCKALRQQGKIQAARQKGEQSLAVLKSTGDRRAQAQVLLQLSRIHMETSNYSVALQTGQQSLELCRELNDPWGTVNVLRHLGDVQQLSGETSQARDAWLEGLQLAADIGHPWANSLSERLEKHAS